jgi:predicted acylesterase/phospholipase RssA
MKKITHLVFSGHALKSLNLCGVLRYIYCYNLDKNIRDVSATSMGSFFALAYALKIPIERLELMIYNSCNDKNISINSQSFINIINSFGFNNSSDYLNEFRNYVKEIYNQDDLTFMELSKKTGINIYVSTTKVIDGSNVIFNVNDYPNVSVFDAVSASMCIPILSKPIMINDYYYIDGFFSNNVPYDVFNHINKDNLLVVCVYINEESNLNKTNKPDSEMTFMEYFFNIFFIFYKNTDILCNYNKMIIYDDFLIIKSSPIGSIFKPIIDDDNIKFNINKKIIDDLFLQGFKELHDYMNNHSNNNLDLALDDIS